MKVLKPAALMDQVLIEVRRERFRQEQLVAAGKFAATCADPRMDDADRLAVLTEEFGEVGTGLLHARGHDEQRDTGLREELIQLAAVAVAWVESIDAARTGRLPGRYADPGPRS